MLDGGPDGYTANNIYVCRLGIHEHVSGILRRPRV